MSIKDDLNPDNALTDLAMRGSEFKVQQVFRAKEYWNELVCEKG